METELETLKKENARLKKDNDRLKEHIYLPKIVNTVFDHFIWINYNISNTIDYFQKINKN